jgi:hypothetical protein
LRLDPFTVFLDENHSKTAQVLKVLADDIHSTERVIRFEECFESGTDDEAWIPEVGKNGWILISADARLWRRSLLRQAIFQHGVRAFIFTENTLRGETRALILRKALPEMRQIVRETPPPFIASLTVEGHANVLYDKDFHERVLRREQASWIRKSKRK